MNMGIQGTIKNRYGPCVQSFYNLIVNNKQSNRQSMWTYIYAIISKEYGMTVVRMLSISYSVFRDVLYSVYMLDQINRKFHLLIAIIMLAQKVRDWLRSHIQIWFFSVMPPLLNSTVLSYPVYLCICSNFQWPTHCSS